MRSTECHSCVYIWCLLNDIDSVFIDLCSDAVRVLLLICEVPTVNNWLELLDALSGISSKYVNIRIQPGDFQFSLAEKLETNLEKCDIFPVSSVSGLSNVPWRTFIFVSIRLYKPSVGSESLSILTLSTSASSNLPLVDNDTCRCKQDCKFMKAKAIPVTQCSVTLFHVIYVHFY